MFAAQPGKLVGKLQIRVEREGKLRHWLWTDLITRREELDEAVGSR